jgi:hypothetical protein
VKVIEGGATTWILEQVIIALSIHGQDIKGYSHTRLGSKLNIVKGYLAQYLGLQGLGFRFSLKCVCSMQSWSFDCMPIWKGLFFGRGKQCFSNHRFFIKHLTFCEEE